MSLSDSIRDKIIDAATVEFSRYGFGAVDFEQIAQMAGIPASDVVSVFGTKEDLASAVIDKMHEVITVPKVMPVDAIDSDQVWRAELKSFVLQFLELFDWHKKPNCYFAGLYRFEAARADGKRCSLHNTCLMPMFFKLEELIALGVKDRDPMQARFWSIALWSVLLNYMLKEPSRINTYIPEIIGRADFSVLALDFMLNTLIAPLHYQRG